ncbi:YigZ family protein [Shewanella cyperi]|uniref:YigZ family protein n=1 Tax=Shewanella cyperi TaxID=2814292 RepID=UPI001A9516EA|nr:YigZ family protein [Shewanella cyperi]QSX40901.1 YigZ family protein [Shewanella cyperi]
MSERYVIPAAELLLEEEIKQSRFITLLFHCDSESRLKSVLTDIKNRFPGASHYCWAMACGAPGAQSGLGSSDDGEPAGCAGRPMLAVLSGSDLGEIGAVVVRYYGGTKLGVGGLVRAYTSGIKQLLRQMPQAIRQLRYPASIECSYGQLKDVEFLLQQLDAEICDRNFAELIKLNFLLALDKRRELELALATQSKGLLRVCYQDAK